MTTPGTITEERPWRTVPVPFTALAGGLQIATIYCRVLSYNVEESTGSGAAVIDIYDGTSTGGIRLSRINLAAAESKEDSFDPPYMPAHGGLWINVTSGSVSGTVLIAFPELSN